jgi:MurNAc alpha-1-phosphate uridylyltransferase
MIKQALILAAGLGTRMGALTASVPKPIIEVAGQSMITRMIDQLIAFGVSKIVINTHYFQDKLIEHVNGYFSSINKHFEVIFSKEKDLLETGGGAIKCLSYLDDEPFFIANSDSIFLVQENIFDFLNRHWMPKMKALFLLCSKADATGYDKDGDFDLTAEGKLVVGDAGQPMPYVYTGVHVTTPGLFDGYAVQRIGLMSIYKRFIEDSDGMYGTKLQGKWLHVGTPSALEHANKILASR